VFQVDLQASTLVANLGTTRELDVEELYNTIAARDWFHIVLIRGEDLKVEGKSTSRLIVAFTSPPVKEMWRHEGKRTVQYVWRTSLLQLEPELAMANSGGTSVSVWAGALEFRPHGAGVMEGTSMKIDLAERVVDIKGFSAGLADCPTGNESALGVSEDTLTMRMRLTDLEVYRMPGVSSKITRSEDLVQ
jgi:hypothetical protein